MMRLLSSVCFTIKENEAGAVIRTTTSNKLLTVTVVIIMMLYGLFRGRHQQRQGDGMSNGNRMANHTLGESIVVHSSS